MINLQAELISTPSSYGPALPMLTYCPHMALHKGVTVNTTGLEHLNEDMDTLKSDLRI